ncbi:hypothetical protein JCGZ_05160 [Jatropha curcas]|uniref:Uncharacterized protein n=1 Tax=Jatropha curcas TaxID=180498 RepID=A0A067L2H3_JATCU|nr:hypothetical protein JCGZ_05160 [Jatropha curcas]
MSLYIQEQITQELHDLAFNKCYEELEGTPKFLTLMEAHVELEPEFLTHDMARPCLVNTPVQGGTPQTVQASASQGTTLDLKHARANSHAPDRALFCLSQRKSYIDGHARTN